MARSRRGRGGLAGLGGGTLGTLWRTTLAQAGAVRDALERGAREGRARLDDARIGRRHEEALAELGAIVLDLVRQGELADLEDIREIADAIGAIEELEAQQAEHAPRERASLSRGRRAPVRGRARAPSSQHDADESGEHAPVDVDPDEFSADEETSIDSPMARRHPRPRSGVDDGTVSSSSWTPPRPAAPERVWRPVLPDEPTRNFRPRRDSAPPERPERADRSDRDDEPGAQFREERRRPGGITFERRDETGPDPDADLADYMNPDDVPPRDKK